jgi:hypothetical protein
MIDFNWDTHKVETESAIDYLRGYVEMIEGQFEVLYEKERSNISEDMYQIFELQFKYNFPSKIRYSIIVLIHILLETRLKAICDEIADRRELEIKECDFKGSSIERSKIFLNKVAKVSLVESESWLWFTDLQKVRDCIVHCNGQVEFSRDIKRINEISTKGLGIRIEEGNYFTQARSLAIERAYCESSLINLKNLFEYIHRSAGFGPSIRGVVR